ncbi:MAG: nucleotide exchange factor GrpE [Rhodospirillaceae bacterium]|nr:nucleotide exchange factor GrpE [Rhodospirillaceae bacterium]|tara:strand:+ start:818 stop:1486 length:669 start_codon:yes stop_codon:yes gene_type:complete
MSTQDNEDENTEESTSSNTMSENGTDNVILDAEAEQDQTKTSIESEAISLEPVDTESKISKMEKEIADLKDQLLRFMAEAENVRKRSERHLAEAHKYGVANLARSILTVADDLSRALQAVPEDQRDGEGLLQTLLGGVEAVERELVKALESNNINRIDPTGEPFDPNFHEAMYEVPDSGFSNGTVAQVVQPGYSLHDRLLRPARVGVAKDLEVKSDNGDTEN